MPHTTTKAGRLEFLDSVRGIAALAVAVYHTFSGASSLAHRLLFTQQNLGDFGVISFFLVSGFIIPVSMERHTLSKFWIARLFRLGPTYWFAMVLILALGWAGVCVLDPVFRHIHPITDFANLVMVAPVVHQQTLVGVSWTLAIEIVFYVLCSVLKVTGALPWRFTTACTAIALYLFWLLLAARGIVNPVHFKGNYGALLLAGFTGSVFYQVQTGKLRARYAYLLVILFLIAAATGRHFEDYTMRNGVVTVVVPFAGVLRAWFAAGAFFCILFACRDRRFPAPLLWLGRISYSLYLMHDVAAVVFENRMGNLNPYVRASVVLAIAVLAAELCFRLIEQPSLRLARGTHRNQPVTP